VLDTQQCDEQIASFVDQELTHHYGRMIKFVETVKAKLAQTASPREINVDKGTATPTHQPTDPTPLCADGTCDM
jgi:hypothetical protein